MSMNSNPQDQEAVRRLIALKRYEQPHPRYFNDFSSRVIARIQSGEHLREQAGAGWFSWVNWLWSAFEAKPVWAGAAGFGACALVVAGFIASETGVSAYSDIPQVPGDATGLLADQTIASVPREQPQATLVTFGSMSGMPTSQPHGSLFEQARGLQKQPTWQNTSAPRN